MAQSISSRDLRARQRYLREQNKRYGPAMEVVPEELWPAGGNPRPLKVWRSQEFLAQLFAPVHGALRLSVCRTDLGPDGKWKDNISWDQMQKIKGECLPNGAWATEIYPPETQVINVANMRHLWILGDAPEYAWRRP